MTVGERLAGGEEKKAGGEAGIWPALCVGARLMTPSTHWTQWGWSGLLALVLLVGALRAEDAPEVKALPLRTPPPDYPRQMQMKQITGVVALLVAIDATGNVTECKVEKATRAEFEQPAVEAVRKWRFKPAERAGQPVASHLLIPIHFRLD